MLSQAIAMFQKVSPFLPPRVRNTALVRLYGLFGIPLIFFVAPVVEELTADRCRIRIPLTWRTKNHLGSMYFGALAVGADLSGALIGTTAILETGKRVELIFKDFSAEFLKRATDDVVFTCTDGEATRNGIAETLRTKERVAVKVNVVATCPDVSGDAPVARFALTLALKAR